MIDRKEIMGFSRDIRLSANIVEKDYVIGWLLAGISNHPNLTGMVKPFFPAWVCGMGQGLTHSIQNMLIASRRN